MYSLSGSALDAVTPEDNCFILSRRSDTAVVARLGDSAQGLNLTQEEVSAMFSYIQIHWNSGET